MQKLYKAAYTYFIDNTVIITDKLYSDAIPKNCRLSTLEDHADILYCWSLVGSLKTSTPLKCGLCEFNNEYTPEEYNNEFQKLKVWEILNDKT